ncbi:hypothetical protein yc1106_08990 [Curvularia clavata]|uniref:Uncharacterized protein n=1 Tax=Curvularia clavata TaxID=95742 RepID=A0A9Q8ZEA9_CURCL|nr:hypothetical protein yc1106_08990 [Curvularia clavata]
MASYFDLPPQKAAPPATIEQLPQDQRKQLGRTSSLMSPAVTQILDRLADDHSDSSSEEDGSISEDEDPRIQPAKKDLSAQKVLQNKQKHCSAQAPRPSSLSPNRSNSKSPKKISGQSTPTASTNEDSSGRPKNKQPHMARFHSLRSMLFQQKIEDRMKTAAQDCQAEAGAAEKWRAEHQERQMHHPTTPEKDAQAKSGIGSRLRMTIRRITTKDAGSMEKIREDGAPVEFKERSSGTSSEAEENQQIVSKKTKENDDDSIKESDVEDLVRWVSRRGPSSDVDAQKDEAVEDAKDSGHESLGHSDVEDLVQHAKRKSDAKGASDEHLGYSDASTEPDTGLQELSSDEEDAEDLVRWISHREGPKAGPVRRNLERSELDSDVEAHYDSDVPELGRWVKRHDGTSGESIATNTLEDKSEQQQIEEEELNRGRPRSREMSEPPVEEKSHITHDDIDDLVRWVSRKDLKRQDTPLSETQTKVESMEIDEDEKKKAVGMTIDDGSLSHSDVQDLIDHARKTSIVAESYNTDAGGVERGDLKKMQVENTPPVRDPQEELVGKRADIQQKEKEKQLGMSVEDGSLSHGDIEDLLAHVKKS